MQTSSDTLPYGWISQIDPNTNHTFYVDTKASPPRSIWVHPYEDEQYLKEHPDVREKVKSHNTRVGDNSRRDSHNGQSSEKNSYERTGSSKPKQRGFIGRLKDKAMGTKEEREAAKKEAELRQQRREQERMQRLQMQQQAYAQQQAQLAQGQYVGAPSPYGYGNPYGQPTGGMGGRRGGGFGGGGMALPLVGGLAGGLLLGEMMDGGDGGGDFGGGDFGGGF